MGVSRPFVRFVTFGRTHGGPKQRRGSLTLGGAGPQSRGVPPPSGYRVAPLYNTIIQISSQSVSQSESVAAMRPSHVLPRRSIIVLDLRPLCVLPFCRFLSLCPPPYSPSPPRSPFPPESRCEVTRVASCTITVCCAAW